MQVDEWDQASAADENQSKPAVLVAEEQVGQRDEFSYSLLEALWLKKQTIDHSDESQMAAYFGKARQVFEELAKAGVVTSQQAHEILDSSTVEKVGLSQVSFMQKLQTRYRTLTFYAQKKFNLMREEIEGFSKLIIELNQANINEQTVAQVTENIQKLVGYFQLDPNRLLDLILCSFQNNVQNLSYLSLVRDFGHRDQITQLVGFKIQHALKTGLIGDDGLPTDPATTSENEDADQQEEAQAKQKGMESGVVDQGLFDLVAMLIKHQLIALEEVWPHIEATLERDGLESKDEVEDLSGRQVQSLDYLYQLMFKTIMNPDQFEREMCEQGIERKHVEIEQQRAKMHLNFKVRLLQSCVRVNDWETTDEIVNGIYEGKFDFTWSRPLLQAMFAALDWCVAQLYKAASPAAKILVHRFGSGRFQLNAGREDYFCDGSDRGIKQATTVDGDLFRDLQRVLRVLGVYLAYDERVFQKVVKVVTYAVSQKPQFKPLALQMAAEVFVPAQALVSNNYGIEMGIWALWKQADSKERYLCYTNMLKMTYLSQPCLVSKQINVSKKFSKWNQRLVEASDSRTKGKQFMKIAFGNCLLAFDLMVTNAKAYENQIEAQIQSISLCHDLALDQMAFMIVKNLADNTESALDQNQNVAKWLINLTDLASQFFKKFSQVDITGLFTFLIHKLRAENSFVLAYMLNQVVAKMFGWSDLDVSQLKPEQLEILSAGFVFMLQGRNQAQQIRSNKKSTEALQSLFWDAKSNDNQKMGLRLMVALAQQVQFVQTEFDTEKLVLVARQFDKMQKYFADIVDTISFLAESQKRFSQLLPEQAAKTLSLEYRLPPQHVFQILRCALPPIFKLTQGQFEDQVAQFKSVLDFSWQSRLDAALASENTTDNEYWDEVQFVTTRKEDLWRHLRPELYTIFWYMNVQNLVVPDKHYRQEIKTLSEQIKKLNEQVAQLKTSGKVPYEAQRQPGSENPKEQAKKSQREIEKLTRQLTLLQDEFTLQTQKQKETLAFLKAKVPDLFNKAEGSGEGKHSNMQELSTVLIQYCFFPRLVHSARDALYAFNFCKLMHKLRVPNFNFLSFFGQILKCIVPAIHFCTEDEAENLGIFFLELFKQLAHWSKKEVWEKECQGYGGFARKFCDPSMCIKHEEFVEKIISSINKRISAAMNFCFDMKSEKMHMKARCGLIILNRVAPVFPNTFNIAKSIQGTLQTLVTTKGVNQDLLTLAGRLNEKLKKKLQSFPEYVAEQKAKAKVAAAAKQDQELKQKADARTVKDSSGAKAAPGKQSSEKGASLRTVKDSASGKNDHGARSKDDGASSGGAGRDHQSQSKYNGQSGGAQRSNFDSERDRDKRSRPSQHDSANAKKYHDGFDDQPRRVQQKQPPSDKPSSSNQGSSSYGTGGGARGKVKAEDKSNRRDVQQQRSKQPEPPSSSQAQSKKQNQGFSGREETKSTSKGQAASHLAAGSKRTAPQQDSAHGPRNDPPRKDSLAASTGGDKETKDDSAFKDPGQAKRPRGNNPVSTSSNDQNAPSKQSDRQGSAHPISSGKTSVPQKNNTIRDNDNRSRHDEGKGFGYRGESQPSFDNRGPGMRASGGQRDQRDPVGQSRRAQEDYHRGDNGERSRRGDEGGHYQSNRGQPGMGSDYGGNGGRDHHRFDQGGRERAESNRQGPGGARGGHRPGPKSPPRRGGGGSRAQDDYFTPHDNHEAGKSGGGGQGGYHGNGNHRHSGGNQQYPRQRKNN